MSKTINEIKKIENSEKVNLFTSNYAFVTFLKIKSYKAWGDFLPYKLIGFVYDNNISKDILLYQIEFKSEEDYENIKNLEEAKLFNIFAINYTKIKKESVIYIEENGLPIKTGRN